MSEVSKIEAVTSQVQSRRAFVKTAAKVAVTAPAAAMLLNASVKPAKAVTSYGDDFHLINPGDDGVSGDDAVFNPGDDFIP
jgi:hypothetical protein